LLFLSLDDLILRVHQHRATILAAGNKDMACQSLRAASLSIAQACEVYTEAATPANYQAALDLRERIARQMQALGCAEAPGEYICR
jgi:hypothetical protein